MDKSIAPGLFALNACAGWALSLEHRGAWVGLPDGSVVSASGPSHEDLERELLNQLRALPPYESQPGEEFGSINGMRVVSTGTTVDVYPLIIVAAPRARKPRQSQPGWRKLDGGRW
jgi:hypothetical protein